MEAARGILNIQITVLYHTAMGKVSLCEKSQETKGRAIHPQGFRTRGFWRGSDKLCSIIRKFDHNQRYSLAADRTSTDRSSCYIYVAHREKGILCRRCRSIEETYCTIKGRLKRHFFVCLLVHGCAIEHTDANTLIVGTC